MMLGVCKDSKAVIWNVRTNKFRNKNMMMLDANQ
jgi:hypothetical protein